MRKNDQQTDISYLKTNICQDANLKFKTILREMREKRGCTQETVARDLGISLSKYKRIESITDQYQVTLTQSAAIYRYFRVAEGFQEVLHLLEPEVRRNILVRVNETYGFLYLVSRGDIRLQELRPMAKKLLKMYSATTKVRDLLAD